MSRWLALGGSFSAKLEHEKPDGVLCIQAALNDPAHAAMLVHEMQLVKQLSEVCTKESDVAGEVRLETIRVRLVSEGLPCASSSSLATFATVCCRARRQQETRICPVSRRISPYLRETPRATAPRDAFPCGLLSAVAAIAVGLA